MYISQLCDIPDNISEDFMSVLIIDAGKFNLVDRLHGIGVEYWSSLSDFC